MRSFNILVTIIGVWSLSMIHLFILLGRLDNDTVKVFVNDTPKNCSPCHCSDKSLHYVPDGVAREFGKMWHESCIWPRPNETRDRILPQMDLDIRINTNYTIYTTDRRRNKQFQFSDCPIRNCYITNNIERADVILLRESDASRYGVIRKRKGSNPHGDDYHIPRNDHQERTEDAHVESNPIVVWYMLESPMNRHNYSNLNNIINWTASYRRDSVINTPYERFTYFKNFTGILPPPTRNFAANKTKKVAAFISNCNDKNGRLAYISELQHYIDVDIYGRCGTLACPRSDHGSDRNPCYDILKKDYKFYLAFENSNCRDYITEKFFWNALPNNVIPIVMGAAPEDYAVASPPASYIHVDDFETPRDLAEYLHRLDGDDQLYNEYFRWHGSGRYINTKFWCRLCSMVNAVKTTGIRVWYGDVQRWWNGPGVCIKPDKKPWASWRDTDRHYGYIGNNTLHIHVS